MADDTKLDRINERLHSIDKTLALNTQQLAEHMRRTALLEKEMQPVSKHVQQMQGAAKLLGILALIATVIGVVSVFK
jgi:hypothetical protein